MDIVIAKLGLEKFTWLALQPLDLTVDEIFCDAAGAGDEITPQAFADETEVLQRIIEMKTPRQSHVKIHIMSNDDSKIY